ncbi:MAG: diguanylate cyclase, partial [Gammaproteobacteria bacterium]|nr:diguanylate cyclase [Gammaproteobacteria bacterium]
MNITDQSYIHAKQMSLIDNESITSLIGVVITALFYTYVLYGYAPSVILLSWFAAISVVYVLRWVVVHYVYRLNTTIEGNSYTWEKIYITGTLAGGLLWGSGSYFLMPENNVLLDAVIVLMIGSLVAAASVAYAPSKFISISFSFPALVPLSAYFFMKTGDENFYMGVLVLIFLIVTFTSGRLIYRSGMKGIMLGVKNDALIEDLRNKVLKIESMAGEMSYQASHDMLTGLINRREFDTRLKEAITDVKYNKRNHVLCYMDLDE